MSFVAFRFIPFVVVVLCCAIRSSVRSFVHFFFRPDNEGLRCNALMGDGSCWVYSAFLLPGLPCYDVMSYYLTCLTYSPFFLFFFVVAQVSTYKNLTRNKRRKIVTNLHCNRDFMRVIVSLADQIRYKGKLMRL